MSLDWPISQPPRLLDTHLRAQRQLARRASDQHIPRTGRLDPFVVGRGPILETPQWNVQTNTLGLPGIQVNTIERRQRMQGEIRSLWPLTRRSEIDLWHFVARNGAAVSQLEADIETTVRCWFHIQAGVVETGV